MYLKNVRPGGYIPEEHVKDMESDGVEISIVYPTVAGVLYRVPDSELLTAMFRTYNDWLAEFCKPFPDRIKGIAALNVDDVRQGVKGATSLRQHWAFWSHDLRVPRPKARGTTPMITIPSGPPPRTWRFPSVFT